VYIPLPNALHHEWTLRSLAAGKHVLCEKPYTRHPADVEKAFDAAAQAGRILMEAYMYRHNPQTHAILDLVRGGAIGELRLVRSTFSHPFAEPGNIRLDAGLDGGALMDVGCYCVSVSRLLGGEPERVTAEQVTEHGVDVRLTGTFRFAGDVLAHFDCGLDMPPQAGLEVLGSTGMLRVADPFHCIEPGIELVPNEGEPTRRDLDPVDSYRLELENLADAAAGTAEPLLGREDALGQARAIEALYRAAAEGRTASLEP
jgi:predicted dehydrogenase